MNKGGLPAIPVYDIHRHYYLHELTQFRAKERVHGANHKTDKKAIQRAMCKLRKEHYG